MTIHVKEIQTPLGLMIGGATDEGVCFIEFTSRVKLQQELDRLCKDLNAAIQPGNNGHLLQLEQELNDYFNKQRTDFTVALQLTGTEFQKSVWRTLLTIPYGKTTTYKKQALDMNNLPAIRAIAATNGQNKHAIIIPCHRVVGSNGKLTGYAAGLDKKEWLINFESDKAGHTLELEFE